MKSFLKYTLATIVGIFLFTIIGSSILFGIIGTLVTASDNKETVIKPNTILYLKFDKNIVDRSSNNPFEGFDFMSFETGGSEGLNDILKNIEKAKDDENIKGIFMELSSISAGIATIDEIREALIGFKESGKFIYTYSEVMTQPSYYLASVSNKIYINPVGSMELKGLRTKSTFFKGALEKLGVEPLIFRHGKFKSAIEPFMLDKMSDANKEQTLTYVQSIWDHVAAEIAKSRGLTLAEINKLASNYTIRNTQDAVDNKIIDGSKYRDEVIDELVTLTGAEKPEKLEMVKFSNYTNVQKAKKHKKGSKDKIAIIYASGEINSGKGDYQTIGSETISQAFRQARRDTTVKAIVLRVNSPGGSGLASDVIWREAVLAQKVKPLIVSMGDLAASGGYYISCPADVIVANEVTLTGSIGVFGLLFNAQELMNKKLGITFDGVKTNEFADIGDVTRPMSEAEKEIIQKEVEDFYKIFIGKVGDGRKMNVDSVDNIGQGRVWSGINAKGLGLVDEFGGLNKAIAIAAEKAMLTDYKTLELPERLDPIEEFINQLTGQAKMKILQNELGENYYFYQKMKAFRQMQGIQARMACDIELY